MKKGKQAKCSGSNYTIRVNESLFGKQRALVSRRFLLANRAY